jgi:hypothetical protein
MMVVRGMLRGCVRKVAVDVVRVGQTLELSKMYFIEISKI